MIIDIANFRKCKKANLVLKKITMIIGSNYSGKTSVLQAIGIVLSGIINPFSFITKKKCDLLINDEGSKSIIRANDENELSAQAIYPEMKFDSSLKMISEHSAGFTNACAITNKERIVFFTELCEPEHDELKTYLDSICEIKNNTKKRIIDTVKNISWDAGHNLVKDMVRDMKSSWKSITNESYGKIKANNWRPNNWLPDLENTDVCDVEKSLQELNKTYEESIANKAIDEEILKLHKKNADKIPELEKKISELKIDETRITQEYEKAKEEVKKHNDINITDQYLTCPCCDKNLLFKSGKLVEYKAPSKKEIEEYHKKNDELNKLLVDISNKTNKISNDLRELIIELRKAEESKVYLKNNEHKNEGVTEENLQMLRADINDKKQMLDMIKTVQKADLIHRKISVAEDVCDQLGPEGMRMISIRKSIDVMNEIYKGLCNSSKWPLVEIDKDFNFIFDGKYPYELCSESAKWRIRVLTQVVIAQIYKDDYVLIDAADILDNRSKSGLLKLALSVEQNFVIASTHNDSLPLPNLSKINGNVYKMDDEICTQVN